MKLFTRIFVLLFCGFCLQNAWAAGVGYAVRCADFCDGCDGCLDVLYANCDGDGEPTSCYLAEEPGKGCGDMAESKWSTYAVDCEYKQTTIYCKVSFDKNGEQVSETDEEIQDMNVENGKTITLPDASNAYSYTGHSFSGWASTATGAAEYPAGATYTAYCGAFNKNITLYAIWDECPAGTWATKTGCKKCRAGTFADAGSASCTSCTAGYYSTEGAGSCSKVQDGYYATGCNGYGNECTGQEICPLGHYCQNATKFACPAGSYADVTGTSNANCTQCAAGTASNTTARTTPCPACAKGTYTNILGQTSCLSCNANRYTNKETGATQCTSCPSYTYASAGSVGEESCIYETCQSYLNSNKSSIINLGYDWDEMSEKWSEACGGLSDGCFVVEPYGDSWDILQHRCCDGSIEQCKLPDRFTECTETCTDIDRTSCPGGVLCDNTTMNTEYKCSGVQYDGDSFCSVPGGMCLCPYQASSVSCASKLGSPWQGSYSTEYRDGEEEAQRKFCYKECSVNCTNDVNAPCPYGKHCDCPDKATCGTPIGGTTKGKEYYPGGTCIPDTEVSRCYIPNFSCPEGYSANLDTWACELKIYSAKLDDQSATTAASPRQIYYYYNTEKYYTGQSGTTLTGQISSITPPTRTGFTFGGYWTAVNGGGTQYIAGATISGLYKLVPTTGTESTLYAFWTGKPITVTLNLDLEDTTGMNAGNTKFFYYYDTVTDSGVRYYRERDGNTLSNAIEHAQNGSKIVYPRDRKGYKFMGYYTERNGEGTQYVSEFGRILDDMYKTVSADTTLYAKWEVAEYTVTYSCGCTAEFGDKCTGTPPEQVKIKYGADFTAAPIPTGDSACKNQGRDFAGWAVSGTEDVLSAEQMVVWKYGENKTLSVSWAKCQAGYYCPPDATEKKQCPMGTTSEAGATKIEQCFMKGGETQICDKNGCYTLPTTVPKVYFSGTATMN